MNMLTEFGYIEANDTHQISFLIRYLLEQLHHACDLAYEFYKSGHAGPLASMHYDEIDEIVVHIMKLEQ